MGQVQPDFEGISVFDEKIKGVFSSQTVSKVGTGDTTRKSVTQIYYFAEEQDNGQIRMEPLNSEYLPSGELSYIEKEELLTNYAPEPELYTKTVYPKMREVQKTVARADRHRSRGETFSAEMEYNNALTIDVQNVRANFGIGLCYMMRGEEKKADDILQRLVKLDATYEEEHKHMFNEFGINLRKTKMLDQAIEYYTKGIDVSSNDENLYYNLARVYFDQEDYEQAAQTLGKCLKLNPEMKEGLVMLNHMKKKGLIGS